MNSNSKPTGAPSFQLWADAGYQLFALGGENAVKVEVMSKKIGVNKSSFYHHFADMDVFIEQLMKQHIQQCLLVEEKERRCVRIDPDLIHVIIEHKVDFLFQRQLLFHRNKPNYVVTLNSANKHSGAAFVELWMKELKVSWSLSQVEAFFELALENFYLQLHPNNCNEQWLSSYFKKLSAVARKF